MRAGAAVMIALLSAAAFADETQVLPRGVASLDVQYGRSRLDKRWGDDRAPLPLIDGMVRHEPGGGLQGTVTARPSVELDWLIAQLLYGVTDQLTAGIVVPVVLRSRVETQLGWTEGDYMGHLGRAYSEDDFWQWAESMGQVRPADVWEGNRGALADMLLAARWRFARQGWLERLGLNAAASVLVALPTGRNADPEELVAVGTNGWEIHSYGDVEVHLAAQRALLVDGRGLERLSIGTDLFFAWLRPRLFQTPRGERHPLLLTQQPYVGDTYVIDGGDWLAATILVDAALMAGPTWATRVSGGSLEKARALPPLLALGASYTYLATAQSDWRSDSALCDYERERHWRPGEKNIFRMQLTASLLRLGLPLQLYATWRTQELLAGRNTRPANFLGAGARLLATW